MHIIALDIETTGLSPEHDKIIEIGAALINLETRKSENQFKTFVNPGVPIPSLVTNLTGITDEDVKNAPKIEELNEQLADFIKDFPIMGHNISFDIGFLETNGLDLPNKRLDSMDIVHIAIPKGESYSLEIVAERLGIKETGKHRALKDVINNTEVMWNLLDIYFSQNNSEETRSIIKKSTSPWKDILSYALDNHKAPNTKYETANTKRETSDTGYNISPNTLQELPPHTTRDITPKNPKQQTIIAVTDRENLSILDPKEYLNEDLFQRLTKKKSLSSEETVFALKILPLLSKTNTLLKKTEISLPRNIKDLWFEYCHTNYPTEILQTLQSSNPLILNHKTFARLAKNNKLNLEKSNLIIDNIDEFYGDVQQAFTANYLERQFSNSNLPEETKKRIGILFGYMGIMYEKHGERFALTLNKYHFSTLEWQKIADLVEKIAKTLDGDSEEEKLIKFLDKSKNGSANLRIELMLIQDGSPFIKITPLNIGELLSEKIWNNTGDISLMGTAITYNQESPKGIYLKRLLNLPEDMPVKTTKNNAQIEIVDLPPTKNPTFDIDAGNYLLKGLERIEKPAFILVNSQKTASILHSKLALPLKNNGITVLTQGSSGGMGKIKLKSQQNPKNTVVIGTYNMWKFLSPTPNTLIVYKVPFPPPGTTPFKEPTDFHGFREYALPSTALKIRKIAKTAKKILLLDSRITP